MLIRRIDILKIGNIGCCDQIIYKLYRLHIKRMMNFNNPTFTLDKEATTEAQHVPLAHRSDTAPGNVYESVA